MKFNDFSKVVFYNNCNNGDIHYSRQFVKYFASKLSVPCYVSHFRCPFLLKDINVQYVRTNTEPLLRSSLTLHDGTLFVNTWIGHAGSKWAGHDGCTLKGNYKMFADYATSLGIELQQEHEFIPEIDYSRFNIGNFTPKTEKNILVCNGQAWSGQTRNFDMSQMLIYLARKYPSCTFFVTEKFDNSVPNIVDANSFFDTVGKSNLNELSYLSTFCKIIIGRASGPFCYSHTKQNLFDPSKTFIVSSNSEKEGHWAIMSDYDVPQKAKQTWHECHVHKSDDCSLSLMKIVEDEINEKFGNR